MSILINGICCRGTVAQARELHFTGIFHVVGDLSTIIIDGITCAVFGVARCRVDLLADISTGAGCESSVGIFSFIDIRTQIEQSHRIRIGSICLAVLEFRNLERIVGRLFTESIFADSDDSGCLRDSTVVVIFVLVFNGDGIIRCLCEFFESKGAFKGYGIFQSAIGYYAVRNCITGCSCAFARVGVSTVAVVLKFNLVGFACRCRQAVLQQRVTGILGFGRKFNSCAVVARLEEVCL